MVNSPNNGHLSNNNKAVEIRGGNCHLRAKGDNTLPLYIHLHWQWQTVLTMDTYLIIIR